MIPNAPLKPLTVLGIDPGTRRLGWGVVRKLGARLIHVAHGVIATNEKAPLCDRLRRSSGSSTPSSRAMKPRAPAWRPCSSTKMRRPPPSSATPAASRSSCARAGLPLAEYAPARVKRTVTGHGRAEKAQVAQIMRVLLGLAEPPPSDAADALALAVTHLQNSLLPAPATALSARRVGPARSPLNGARRNLV